MNSFKKGKTKIGPLEDNHGNIVSDPKIMADIFNSSFSANFDTKSWLDNHKKEFVESLRDDIDKEGFQEGLSTRDRLARAALVQPDRASDSAHGSGCRPHQHSVP